MKITDFNFLPASYDRIKYIHTTTVNLPTTWESQLKVVNTGNAGFFIPVLLVSLDGETWYSADHPPVNSAGADRIRATIEVEATRFIVLASKDVPGILHLRVMGIEL